MEVGPHEETAERLERKMLSTLVFIVCIWSLYRFNEGVLWGLQGSSSIDFMRVTTDRGRNNLIVTTRVNPNLIAFTAM